MDINSFQFTGPVGPQILLHILSLVVWVVMLVLVAYIAILVIKALRRAIIALDLYIKKNKEEN